jgi:hypothetical protein
LITNHFTTPALTAGHRLADNKTLRSELVSFPLALGSEGGIVPSHRPGLLPLLTRLLFPKLRRRTGRLAGKGALGSARAAVLNFLAFMEPQELRPLLEAFLTPMQQVWSTSDVRFLVCLLSFKDTEAHVQLVYALPLFRHLLCPSLLTGRCLWSLLSHPAHLHGRTLLDLLVRV